MYNMKPSENEQIKVHVQAMLKMSIALQIALAAETRLADGLTLKL